MALSISNYILNNFKSSVSPAYLYFIHKTFRKLSLNNALNQSVKHMQHMKFGPYLHTFCTAFYFRDDRFLLQIPIFARQNTFELINILFAFHL